MKKKTFYILAFICTISLFSAAKQSGKDCKTSCPLKKQQAPTPEQLEHVSKTSFELAPLAWLL